MTLRVISAFAALPLFFIVIFFLPPIFFPIAMAILCLISVYELLWRSHIARDWMLMTVASIYAVLMPFWFHFQCPQQWVLPGIFVMVLVLFLIWFYRLDKLHFGQVTATLFGGLMVPLFLSSTIGIFNMEHGKFLVLIPFIAAWMTDTGAYFSGFLFGKHKLAPKISPKKTIEGAVGGTIVCIVAFMIYGAILQAMFDVTSQYVFLAIAGFVLSLIGQIGDLSLSIIKREFQIKDYGVIFPGHGGILDRFDSVLFTAPASLIVLQILQVLL